MKRKRAPRQPIAMPMSGFFTHISVANGGPESSCLGNQFGDLIALATNILGGQLTSNGKVCWLV